MKGAHRTSWVKAATPLGIIALVKVFQAALPRAPGHLLSGLNPVRDESESLMTRTEEKVRKRRIDYIRTRHFQNLLHSVTCDALIDLLSEATKHMHEIRL